MYSITDKLSVKNCSRLLAVGVTAVMLWGCGKEKFPEPPLDKNRLLIDAMENIRNKNHNIALVRLQKLKLLYPDNIALAALIENEFDNIFIHKVQCSLDQGNLDAALIIIQRAIKLRPLDPQLLAAQEKLTKLQILKHSLDNVAAQHNALAMQQAIQQTAKLIKQNSEFKSYNPVLGIYRTLARAMAKNELRDATRDLANDLKATEQTQPTNSSLIQTMKAQLAVEQKNSH